MWPVGAPRHHVDMPENTALASAPAATTLRNHVAGSWVDVDAVETLVDRDPATGEAIADVPLSGAAAVAAAAAAAKAAQRDWREVPPQVRARHLMALREVLDAHRDELAALVTRDMGKTLPDALGEVAAGSSRSRPRSASPTC